MLQKQPELRVIGEASNGLVAVQNAQELQPDLILLDVGLPKLSGIEAARRIRDLSPASKILFLTQYRSREIAEEALCTGASGYIVKSHAGGDLLRAVNTVLQGQQFVSAGLGDH
jgi:DNA-binding NarL/FixJ family response regulator